MDEVLQFNDEAIDSGAEGFAKRLYHGAYIDNSSINGSKHPDVKRKQFMDELHEHLKKSGLQLIPKSGQSVVHSSRGGSKYGKATGYHVRKIDGTQHSEIENHHVTAEQAEEILKDSRFTRK